MIIILEGISKTGKSSWYKRNEDYLKSIWPYITKFHMHNTEDGSRLKKLYFDQIAFPTVYGKSNLVLQYTAEHLHHAMNITPVYQDTLKVLDRSLISTFCITFPQMLATMEKNDISVSPNIISYMSMAIQLYFDNIANANGRKMPITIYFDGSVENERYAGMELEQSFYSNFYNADYDAPLIRVDASKSIQEVDMFVKCELDKILLGKKGFN